MKDPVRSHGHRKVRNKVFALLAGLVLLDLAAWFGVNALGHYQLRRYESKMEAKGEHFKLADFVPKAVPDNRNFAFAPVVAGSYLADLDQNGHELNPKRPVVSRLKIGTHFPENLTGDWALQKETDLAGLQTWCRTMAERKKQFPRAPRPQTAATDVLLALSKYSGTIEDLRQASALPDSRFPLNYDADPPGMILLPHLAGLKECCQVLELRAVAELANDQSSNALADLKLAFRLIDSVRTEPFDVSQLARTEMLHMTLQPVWEGIREHDWSEAQLVELDTELSGLDFLADCEFSERTERAMLLATVDYVRRTRELGLFSDSDGKTPIPFADLPILRFGPDFIYYQNELQIAQSCQEWLLPIVDTRSHTVSPETAALAANEISQLRDHYSANNILAALALPRIEESIQRFAYAQSSVDMARIACALERFWLVRGDYPAHLDALTPKYLASIPHDVIGGKSLIYYPFTNWLFVLYSVGWNGTNDNGKVYVKVGATGEILLTQGDWVWSDAVSN